MDIAINLNNIGLIYDNLEQYDKSLEYHQKALENWKAVDHQLGIATSLNNIGIIYRNLKNYTKALEYYKQSLEIKEKMGNKYRITTTLNNIAETYLLMKEYNKAYPYFIRSIKLAREISSGDLLKYAYHKFSDYYRETGNYKLALDYYTKYTTLNDSIYSKETSGKIAEMQARYETEKKEKEIQILTQESEIQTLELNRKKFQQYYFGGIIFILIVLLFILTNRNKLRQKHLKTELERKNLDIEQRLLRSQMNPHFIFNSLNSIQSFISSNNAFLAMSYLSKFARLMRLILENTRKSYVSLEDEINTLQLNMELEQIRFKEKFDFSIDVDPGIEVKTTLIPPMLMQPYIENAIIHGLMHKSTKGNLDIHFDLSGQVIKCSIVDDGIGREKAAELKKEQSSKRKSVGMQVTNERLAILNKRASAEIKVAIIDMKDEQGFPCGTRVELDLPFKEEW